MIWWLIFLAVVLVILGIAYLRGKCDGLIAGYNTSSPEKQKEYDIKRLRLIVACCDSSPILPLPDEGFRFGGYHPPLLCRSTVRRGGFPRQYLGEEKTQVNSHLSLTTSVGVILSCLD